MKVNEFVWKVKWSEVMDRRTLMKLQNNLYTMVVKNVDNLRDFVENVAHLGVSSLSNDELLEENLLCTAFVRVLTAKVFMNGMYLSVNKESVIMYSAKYENNELVFEFKLKNENAMLEPYA